MPSLRITFPGKDEPTLLGLRGRRITIGRLADNTIQILDRTVSGHHAELIEEDGHYRLRDTDSSNGVQIDGVLATDFHLRHDCRITFGTVECEFLCKEAAAEVEALPTQTEVQELRAENGRLNGQLAALREELFAVRQAYTTTEDGTSAAAKDYDRMAAECTSLKEAQISREEEVARLKTELAVLHHDRGLLQRALDEMRLPKATAGPIAAMPALAVPPAARRLGASEASDPSPAPTAPVATSAPVPPATPSVPVAKPAIASLPKPTAVPGSAPLAGQSGVSAPKPTTPLGIPKPATATGESGEAGRPVPKAAARPNSLVPPPKPPVGPKGTQKIGV